MESISTKSSDSVSSDDDSDDVDDVDDSEDDTPPAVIFNHPLVNDLLDRFMHAQLQNDTSISNNTNNNNNCAGKMFEISQ